MEMTTPSVQSALISLWGDSVFAVAIRAGAAEDLEGTLKMILSQAKDNRAGVARIVGEELLKHIETL